MYGPRTDTRCSWQLFIAELPFQLPKTALVWGVCRGGCVNKYTEPLLVPAVTDPPFHGCPRCRSDAFTASVEREPRCPANAAKDHRHAGPADRVIVERCMLTKDAADVKLGE